MKYFPIVVGCCLFPFYVSINSTVGYCLKPSFRQDHNLYHSMQWFNNFSVHSQQMLHLVTLVLMSKSFNTVHQEDWTALAASRSSRRLTYRIVVHIFSFPEYQSHNRQNTCTPFTALTSERITQLTKKILRSTFTILKIWRKWLITYTTIWPLKCRFVEFLLELVLNLVSQGKCKS